MAFDQKYLRRYGYFYRSARRYTSRREILVSTYLIISLFTVSFFAVVFIRPTAVTIAKLWREIQDKKVVHTQLEKKIGDLEKAQAFYSSITDYLGLINQALPADNNYSRFLKEIEYLAIVHELRLTSARYDGINLYTDDKSRQIPADINTYSFTLSLIGSFKQLRSFLADLESLDRLATLKSFYIQPFKGREVSEQYILSLNLDSAIYSFPEGLDLEKK